MSVISGTSSLLSMFVCMYIACIQRIIVLESIWPCEPNQVSVCEVDSAFSHCAGNVGLLPNNERFQIGWFHSFLQHILTMCEALPQLPPPSARHCGQRLGTYLAGNATVFHPVQFQVKMQRDSTESARDYMAMI